MYHTDEAGRRVYTIVEIKYCRDTQPEGQTARAAEQHKALAQCIRQHDKQAQVQEVPLMLGVSGVIYNNFIAQMRQLGVDGPLLEGLLRRLHFTAIRGLHRIWRQRAALIQQTQHSSGRQPENSRKRPHPATQQPEHRKKARTKPP
jgi:hypothetical protein